MIISSQIVALFFCIVYICFQILVQFTFHLHQRLFHPSRPPFHLRHHLAMMQTRIVNIGVYTVKVTRMYMITAVWRVIHVLYLHRLQVNNIKKYPHVQQLLILFIFFSGKIIFCPIFCTLKPKVWCLVIMAYCVYQTKKVCSVRVLFVWKIRWKYTIFFSISNKYKYVHHNNLWHLPV